MIKHIGVAVWCAGLAIALSARPAVAQPNPATTASAPPEPTSKVAVVGVPIPISNEAIGWGFAGVFGLVFPAGAPGSKTPPSIIGGGAGYTSSHSWLAGGAANLLLGDNRWRLLGGFGKGTFHYRLFGTGTDAGDDGRSIPIDQHADFLISEALVRTVARTFVGVRYVYMTTSIGVGSDVVPPDTLPIPPDVPVPGSGSDLSTHLIAFRAERDTRNDRFWPTTGRSSI